MIPRCGVPFVLACVASWVGSGAVQAQPVGEGRLPVEVVARAVSPDTVALGGEAVERLVVWAPEGVTIAVADALPGGDVERLGRWSASRASADSGRVVWTFAAPFTVWRAGTVLTPPLSVTAQGPGVTQATHVQGPLPVEVFSPIPAGARVVRPSPPLEPDAAVPLWAGLLVALPALTAAGSGLAWWRRRGGTPGPAPSAPPADTPPRASLDEAMAGVEADPAATLVLCAAAVRAHPRVLAAGVAPWHTTTEVQGLLAHAVDLASVPALLSFADAVKYADAEPTAQEVLDVVAPLAERLGHG